MERNHTALKYWEIIHWDAVSFLTLHDGYNSKLYRGRISPTILQDAVLFFRRIFGGVFRFLQMITCSFVLRKQDVILSKRPYLLLITHGIVKYANEEREICESCIKKGLGVFKVYPSAGICVSTTGQSVPVFSILMPVDYLRAMISWLREVFSCPKYLFSRDRKARSLFISAISAIRQHFVYVALTERIVAAHGVPEVMLSLCPGEATSVTIAGQLKKQGVFTAGMRTQTTSADIEHLAINTDILFCKSRNEKSVYAELFAGTGPRLEEACLLSLPETYQLDPLVLPDKYVLLLGTAPVSNKDRAGYENFNKKLFSVAEMSGLPIVFKGHNMAVPQDDAWFASDGRNWSDCLRITDIRRNRELIDHAALIVMPASTLLYYAILRGTPVIIVPAIIDFSIPDEFQNSPINRIALQQDIVIERFDLENLRNTVQTAERWFNDNYFLQKGADYIIDFLLREASVSA